jgi:hypothetical protein
VHLSTDAPENTKLGKIILMQNKNVRKEKK